MTLSEYMKRAGLDALAIARKLKCSEGAVRKWQYGERTPRKKKMLEIYYLTRGQVTANDFLGFEE